MASRYAQNPVSRYLPWIAAFVLIAGVVAFAVTRIGGSSEPSAQVQQEAAAQGDGSSATSGQTKQKSVPFSPEARKVASEFLQTAVPRKNLKRSWELTHPELKQGYTLSDWMTGTIPVQFYPTEGIDLATFKIDESYANEAVIEVALLPKKGEDVKPQIFFVGLKKHKGQWLVNYFAPRSAIAVPESGQGF
jgi:hypothetical protein